tara:strand:+ start:81 stop:980 length:900 start_codon:yes stop_codon:yes gene_type:complete
MADKIMLIGSGGIGDLYMFLPALKGIKEKWGKDTEIHLLTDEIGGPRRDLVWGQPNIHKLIGQKEFGNLPVNDFDLTYNVDSLTFSPTALLKDNIHIYDMWERVFGLNMWKNYPPKIYYTKEEEVEVSSFVGQFDYPVLIHTIHTDRYPAGKALPQKFWEWLLPQYPNIQFLQVGTKGSGMPGSMDFNLNHVPNVIDIRGKHPIRLAGLLMNHARFHISMDSIMAHLSATTQTKGVVIWGATSPNYFGHKHNVNLYLKKECSPCIELAKGIGHCCQKNGIEYPWKEIKSAVDRLIKENK